MNVIPISHSHSYSLLLLHACLDFVCWQEGERSGNSARLLTTGGGGSEM